MLIFEGVHVPGPGRDKWFRYRMPIQSIHQFLKGLIGTSWKVLVIIYTWYPKHNFFIGWFKWMTPKNLLLHKTYMKERLFRVPGI